MWLIVSLILVGLLLLVAELVLLPGISIAGIGAFLSLLGAVLYGYFHYGVLGGSIVLTVVVILSVLSVVISLRANTWQRLALKSTIENTAGPTPQQNNVTVGQRGITLTRLAPMGKVRIGPVTAEAKAIDSYLDPEQEVEVIGFDNSVVVVQKSPLATGESGPAES